MRFDSPSRPVIDARTEKEVKLKSFIADAVAVHDGAAPLTLVARATDSPVARALAACISESGRSDLAVHLVLFDIDSIVEDHAAASILDLRACDVRVLHDVRFVSAHEQLVLSADRIWIGDCMRRDPQKRDAFEIYHSNDASCAAHAVASFARLWAAAKPLARAIGRTLAPEVIAAGQAPAADCLPTPRR
ncbi:MAG: hypothetical protein ACT4OU_00915 [Hyphomicrobium sp.]